MKRRIILGCLLAAFIMMLLPSTSVAESSTVNERTKIQQEYIEEMLEEIEDDPHAPLCILRLLLWLRNVLIIGIIYIVIQIIKDLLNKSAPAI